MECQAIIIKWRTGWQKQRRVGIMKWSKGQELLVTLDGAAEVQVLRKEEH